MRALSYSRYGGPEVLQAVDLPCPKPGSGEILVKVEACALNGADYEIMTGWPIYSRMWGWMRPKIGVLGSDVAGYVEAVGTGVDGFAVGDAVIGELFEHWGGLAEYVTAPASLWVMKPEALPFVDAAALPQAGVLALQATRDVVAGQRVLIAGAGGGVGTFALQMVKAKGAHAVAEDNATKGERLRELGADVVLDYRADDVAALGLRFDLIIDCVCGRPVLQSRRLLKPGGRFWFIGGPLGASLIAGIAGPILSRFDSRDVRLLLWDRNPRDVEQLAQMAVEGQIVPVIDKVFPLGDAPGAMQRLGSGQSVGKVMVAAEN
ncbi:NAD(P)-dependent alcohol dehydrogenase [Alisedimentitalea sp. MJ-SS2]|uniref:NAD(P)-dependent alcohol dehydrogenase n=1 Tax=Aliisedimentitalea sp. MJ-SS2 TaxID=3049795 RepID=UPI00290798E8|nr:NAD(P)-dependent alcohol dehydrogenase [Alisedimentitalea sp. MJ-SS2]MDU8927562.1 NAD(P)-dependent alcohol dehydrogenase [Alisedimentitalea sp. MJ-SS2]